MVGSSSDKIGGLIRGRSLIAMWGHSEKVAVCKPRRESSPEPDHAGTQILDFHPPELWRNKFLLLMPSSVWYFVMAAWADYDKEQAKRKLKEATKQICAYPAGQMG